MASGVARTVVAFRLLALLVLAPSVVGQPSCGPECKGQCFGGHCLFSTSQLQDDTFRALLGTVYSEQRSVLPAAASGDSPTSQDLPAHVPPEVWQKLREAETKTQSLSQENAVLQQQLDAWREAGQRVATREAHVAELLEKAKKPAPAELMQQPAPELVQQGNNENGDQIPAQSTESLMILAPHYTYMILWALILLAIVFLVFQNSGAVMSRCSPWRGKTSERTPLLKGSSFWDSFGCLIGRSAIPVQLSEMQIHNAHSLLMLGNMRVVAHSASGQVLKTIPVHSEGRHLVHFQEVLTLQVRRHEAPVMLELVGEDEHDDHVLARLLIPSQEIIRLAHLSKEYFRFDFSVDGMKRSSRNMSNWPYIALKITVGTPANATCTQGKSAQSRHGVEV